MPNSGFRPLAAGVGVATLLTSLVFCAQTPPTQKHETDDAGPVFTMKPIGQVVNRKGEAIRLEIAKPYRDGLLGLDQWSHVQVFYWFDKNDTPQRRRVLQVHPRGKQENPLTGVFACRAPVRPNLIALSTCKILEVKIEDGVVVIDGIDAFDTTPILDLKPYAPGPDRATGRLRVPDWARRGR